MKKLKLYLDTSIFNFALADDVPYEKGITLRLFDEIISGKYEAFISELVILEINRAPQEIRIKLSDLIKRIVPEELAIDEDSQNLAKRYINQGIIPTRYENDALHIAVASVNDLDVLVSWNFKHIVKVKTKKEVTGVNALMGYKEIEIYSPLEVVEYV
ncbi:MAG: type II toxin-antitoxin system VapC family toxin [bacterium]